MDIKSLMDWIPPDQIPIFATSLASLIIATLGGSGYIARAWFLERFADMKQEREIEYAKLKAEWAKQETEMQARLDETQSSRESLRLFFSEMAQAREAETKRLGALQEAFDRQEKRHVEQLDRITEVFRGIEINTAATLGLLKEHREGDEIMGIKQEKIISQNDTTHQRISELTGLVDAIAIKIDNLQHGQKSDKAKLEDIHKALVDLQAGLKALESAAKTATHEAPKAQDAPPVVDESLKELSTKTNEEKTE